MENIKHHPQVVRDQFLYSNDDYRALAISRSKHSGAISSAVRKEAKLGHLATFFRGRQELGLYGKMNPNTSAAVRGGPGRGVNLKAMRPADPQYWTRKTMAKDLKNAKLFLQQSVLTAETLDNFDLGRKIS